MLQAARWWAEKSDAEEDVWVDSGLSRSESGNEIRNESANHIASPGSRTKQPTWEEHGAKMASTLASANASVNGKHASIAADMRR